VTAFDAGKIDDVLHNRLRFGSWRISRASRSPTSPSPEDALEPAQGNVSVPLRKLEDAGYVVIERRAGWPASRSHACA
jgi:hypothetical protein